MNLESVLLRNRCLSPNQEAAVSGKTLAAYWFMYQVQRPLSTREVQRGAGLSSSSLALHHLNKLIEFGLVTTDEYGGYVIKSRAKPGPLRLFVRIGPSMIPWVALYASACTGFALSCVLILALHLELLYLCMSVVLGVTALLFWFETWRVWGLVPA